MGYVVRMPQLGMTMEEGVVVEWTADVGEEFEAGDVILVVESEKTTNDVEAREEGVILEQFVELDEPVSPGDPIAYVGDPDEDVPDEVRAEATDTVGQNETAETVAVTAELGADAGRASASESEGKVSPRARSYAASHDVPTDRLTDLDGSGPDGAVIERDVIQALEQGGLGVGHADAATSPTGAPQGRRIYEERTGSQLRQSIADKMNASVQVPQVTLNRRVPVDALLTVKERLAEDLDREFSLTDFLIAAVVEAVDRYPEFNAVYEDGVHRLAQNVNVGVAVDIDGGLVTPVVEGANRLTIEEIHEERSRLVEASLSGDYTMDDLADGTFTITNLGHFDVASFDPLLNVPEVATLGVGVIESEYDPETAETDQVLGLSLTFDHRAVDGADAARFLDELAEALTHPLRLALPDRVNADEGGEHETAGTFRETTENGTGMREALARSSEGLQATVTARRFEWDVDEPEEIGGSDTAPTPVEQFLGGLSSCLALMIRHVADRWETPVDDIEVSVDADPNEGRIERIAAQVRVTSEADEGAIERVVRTAERACYVNQVVDDDIERDLSVDVREP